MIIRLLLLFIGAMAVCINSRAQSQTCPLNINFGAGDLSNWSATTGLVNNATRPYPAPNNGVTTIPEYGLGTTGIQVITNGGTDLYGSFPTIPTVNGYSYGYSIKLGSTATSWDLNSSQRNPGGFIRSVSYNILVPAGPTSEPYTMTYAYALVLENGTHNSNEQPMFAATLSTPDSIITCASPQYYLPTFNNGNNNGGGSSTGADLDTASALANGFSNSPVLFLSHAGDRGGNGILLQDVWTKPWTEVTFDLAPYRGRQVTLTFTANNCDPGAHFAYAYVAVRNSCAGLEISGPQIACQNGTFTYSIPALANASYNWQVPTGWSIVSGNNTHSIEVIAGPTTGNIIAHEVNGCADLRDTIQVSSNPPTIAGTVAGDNTVCTGTNITLLTHSGQRGDVIKWLSSTNGTNWQTINNTTSSYSAQNLTATTQYTVVVQNGASCEADTTNTAIIQVDPKSVGGRLTPDDSYFCLNQQQGALLTLEGNTGNVVNWQVSPNNATWQNFNPSYTATTYAVNNINANAWYRTIVKSGVCEPDTSDEAALRFVNVPFPAATHSPATDIICYGDSIFLNATITIGTSYTWSPVGTLTNQGNGSIPSLPHTLQAKAKPLTTTNYILAVSNAGCPNVLRDTFNINVRPAITVNAGNDTVAVLNQPLQLNATVSPASANIWSWTPPTHLNFSTIANPVAIMRDEGGQSITYTVRATDASGCYGTDTIRVKVYYTLPDIFVPNAFSPNGDGNNDVIRPVCVGIAELKYFRIYNRWGQMVFSTTEMKKGWDGNLGGKQQSSGTFVYIAVGIDYLGEQVSRRGTVTLIR